MGMGEPLANEGAVWAAVERIHGDLGLSARHITISTVGIVPGIRALAARPLPVNLAVSLHAANDALRDELVPINRRYPLDALVDACTDYLAVKNRRISFEWAMIDGVNDRPGDAVELAALCRRLRPSAHVNLIPLNPTPGYPTKGTALGTGHRVPRPPRSARRQRDDPPEPRHRDRRRLRPTRRRPARPSRGDRTASDLTSGEPITATREAQRRVARRAAAEAQRRPVPTIRMVAVVVWGRRSTGTARRSPRSSPSRWRCRQGGRSSSPCRRRSWPARRDT